MKFYSFVIWLFLIFPFFSSCNAQDGQIYKTHIHSSNSSFDNMVREHLNFTVPSISVDSLSRNYDQFVVVDTRSSEEYNTSHLPGARFLSYKNPNWDVMNDIDLDQPVVVYCSIGYRSEKIAEKLQKKGYKVFNLYGSIFEWANTGHRITDNNGVDTKTLHGYNKSWSKWIETKNLKAVY